MSSTFMIETPFMSSELKSSKSSVCVAGGVDQNVELRKLFGDLFVKSGDRFRIGNVASKGVNSWKGSFRTVHLGLIAARDKNRVTKRRELFGEFVTDAAGTAGDQNRIARKFHN